MQWAVCLEPHESGGHYFHMAIKLDRIGCWVIKNLKDTKHGIKLNFPTSHNDYYMAFKYVIKEDTEVLLSAGHPNLSYAEV